LSGDQELDVVNIGNFGRVHQEKYEPDEPTKSTA
jgi:hypothetical protein